MNPAGASALFAPIRAMGRHEVFVVGLYQQQLKGRKEASNFFYVVYYYYILTQRAA